MFAKFIENPELWEVISSDNDILFEGTKFSCLRYIIKNKLRYTFNNDSVYLARVLYKF